MTGGRRLLLGLTGALAGALVGLADARADESAARVPLLPLYRQECGTCHTAYPPHLLPAASWARQMGGLVRHYGTDASLDPADAEALHRWLVRHADPHAPAGATAERDRITLTPGFQRKHRAIEPAVWRLPSVRSASNCAACHTDADTGRFREGALRQPAGLSPRQRAAWAD